jgi:hypothetical protein
MRAPRFTGAAWVLRGLLFAGLWLLPLSGRAELLAVIDRSNPTSAELTADQLSLLAQSIRGEAARHLGTHQVAVLSEENTVSILRDMGVDLATCESECDVETARRLQADWLISSKLVRFGSQWTYQLNLFQTETGRLKASEQLAATRAEELVNALPRLACRLLAVNWAPDSTCQALLPPIPKADPALKTTPRPATAKPAAAERTGPASPTPAPAPVLQPETRSTSGSTRCLGTTLSGTRCKHMTTSTTGYCWQHVDQAAPALRPATPGAEPARCRATTQRGTRCTRRATHNGYCWQHKK